MSDARTGRQYTPRVNRGGNFCGHDPANPRFVSVVNPYSGVDWQSEMRDSFGHQRKAAIFYDFDEKMRDFYFFPKTIPGLGLIEKIDGNNRKNRSERRENTSKLLPALVHHMELASVNWEKGFVRVGMPTESGFLYFDNQFWMKKTGLSESQLKREFMFLKERGYITRERRWVERDKGKFKGLATMTLLHLELFKEMGLFDSLKESAKFAYKRLQEEAARLQTKVSRMLRCAVESLRPLTKPPKASPIGDPKNFPPNDHRHWLCQLNDEAQRQEFNRRYINLFLEYGELRDKASIFKEAFLSLRRQT